MSYSRKLDEKYGKTNKLQLTTNLIHLEYQALYFEGQCKVEVNSDRNNNHYNNQYNKHSDSGNSRENENKYKNNNYNGKNKHYNNKGIKLK